MRREIHNWFSPRLNKNMEIAMYGHFGFSLLLLPTAAMGATLPLLARFATERVGAAGNQVGTLYAVNTAGAVVGTLLAGFVLLPEYGLGGDHAGARRNRRSFRLLVVAVLLFACSAISRVGL